MANIIGIEVSGDTYDIEDSQARQDTQTNAQDIDGIEDKIPSTASSSNKLLTKTEVGNTTDWVNGTNCSARVKNGIVFVKIIVGTEMTLSGVATKISELPSSIPKHDGSIDFTVVDNQRDVPLHARMDASGNIYTWANPNTGADYTVGAIYGILSYPV